MKAIRIIIFPLLILFVSASYSGKFIGSNGSLSTVDYPFSPACISLSDDGSGLLVLEATAQRIDLLNRSNGELIKGQVFKGMPTGMCRGSEGLLYVTTNQENGQVHLIDSSLTEIGSFKSGPGSRSPVFLEKRNVLAICHTWLDEMGFYSIPDGELLKVVKLLKQPYKSVLSLDEKYLFAANFTTHQRADKDTVSSAVSVINTETMELEKNILLANGSNALRGMTLSSDGNYVLVSHNLGRFQVPTTQLEQGWMNTSALSLIRISDLSYVGTILLDETEYGAAGSWGVDSYNGKIVVAHSGTHDFSLINEEAFFNKLETTDNKPSLAYDLNFLSGIRSRIKVPGNGPRAIAIDESGVWLGMYFSDTINHVTISGDEVKIVSLPLNSGFVESKERLGEKYFNDASYCFQGWQSCNGCHPMEARTDGLNWDLLNDGVGNPRNCKSMLLAHRTPPAMITGIRADAETAVRAGFKYIQFASVPEEYASAVDSYLMSLKPMPSPYLIEGKLSPEAVRGKRLYEELGCSDCHSGPYYTDMKKYSFSSPNDTLGPQSWDTPTLIEVWRTGPYLHDGRCAKMEHVFTREGHGINAELTESELNELVKYVLSL